MPFARVNEIYDLHTETGRLALLKFHTPQDGVLQKHLAGHFMQYRRWLYGGMDIMMIPVATLPLDPLGVSLNPGEPNADPRDVINPICHRFYHGEKLSTRFDGETIVGTGGVSTPGNTADNLITPWGKSVNQTDMLFQESINGDSGRFTYGNTLMDTSWKKSHVQRGFRTSCRPMIYNMTANHQIGNAIPHNSGTAGFETQGIPDMGFGDAGALRTDAVYPSPSGNMINNVPGNPGATSPQSAAIVNPGLGYNMMEKPHADMAHGGNYTSFASLRGQQIFTTGMRPMGWMDTTPYLITGGSGIGVADKNAQTTSLDMRCPLVYMYTALLPPAFKTNMYFRLIISHKVAFKGYRSTQGLSGTVGSMTVSQPLPFPAPGVVPTGSITAENSEITLVTDGVIDVE